MSRDGAPAPIIKPAPGSITPGGKFNQRNKTGETKKGNVTDAPPLATIFTRQAFAGEMEQR